MQKDELEVPVLLYNLHLLLQYLSHRYVAPVVDRSGINHGRTKSHDHVNCVGNYITNVVIFAAIYKLSGGPLWTSNAPYLHASLLRGQTLLEANLSLAKAEA